LVVYIVLVVLAFIMVGTRNRAGCGWFVFILLLPALAILVLLVAGKKELPKPKRTDSYIAAPSPLRDPEPEVEEPAFALEDPTPPAAGASGLVVTFRLLAAFLLVGALSLVLYVLSHPGVSERGATKPDSNSSHIEYDPSARAEARRDQVPDFTPLLKPDIANNALANSELVPLGK
jgi:hypothetical protein